MPYCSPGIFASVIIILPMLSSFSFQGLFFLIISFCLASVAHSQPNAGTDRNAVSHTLVDKGKIVGKVLDAVSGEPLIGVTVKIEGTRVGAKTNLDGLYTLAIEPGQYTLTVSRLGYEKKRIEGANISSGESKKIDILLKQQAVSGEEVIVSAKIVTESQTAQLLERKRAATMNDVLGAEQIRRAPDATSADAIKRMPGVTISGNKYINIRGASERYNNALLNGAALTSTDPDKKAFSFDLLPSNLLDNAIVTKTFTPDLPGNFSGGLVQLNTINFPDKFASKISFASAYAPNVTRESFTTYTTGSKDWLGYDDGTRALPSSVPLYSLLDTSINDARRREIGRSFSNAWGTNSILALPTANFSASLGDAFPIFDNEFGYVASLSYKNQEMTYR